MLYAPTSPFFQHFDVLGQRRQVDSKYCSAWRRSEISSPMPFSGMVARISAIIGRITAMWQILRPSAARALFTSARASTSEWTIPMISTSRRGGGVLIRNAPERAHVSARQNKAALNKSERQASYFRVHFNYPLALQHERPSASRDGVA